MAGGNMLVPMSHPPRLKNRNKDSTNLILGFGTGLAAATTWRRQSVTSKSIVNYLGGCLSIDLPRQTITAQDT